MRDCIEMIFTVKHGHREEDYFAIACACDSTVLARLHDSLNTLTPPILR